MAFDSRLHAAYLEEGPDPNEVSEEHLRELDEAEPHPIMDFFRGFWRRLFLEQTPAAANFKGLLWMFLGVANSDGLLYDDELQGIAEKTSRDSFRVDYALSREQENKKGGKMYIQDKVEEHADEIFERLDNGAHIYFCGLKGMMPGIQDMLDDVCRRKGLGDNAKDFVKGLKKKGQWHVEVY